MDELFPMVDKREVCCYQERWIRKAFRFLGIGPQSGVDAAEIEGREGCTARPAALGGANGDYAGMRLLAAGKFARFMTVCWAVFRGAD